MQNLRMPAHCAPIDPAEQRALTGGGPVTEAVGAFLDSLHLTDFYRGSSSPLCPPSSSRRRGPSLAWARSWPRASTTFSSNSKAFPGGTHFCLHTQVRNPSPLVSPF